MGIVIALVILALLLGGIGFVVEGLLWLVAIAAIILIVGAVLGFTTRGGGRATV
jgi:hypothetical protein